MKRFSRTVATAAAVAAVTMTGSAQPARAADPSIGAKVLNELCRRADGQSFFTPFTISRCQEARSRRGFEVEALICEGLLGGRFTAVDSPTRNNRTNWACISGPAAS